MPKFTVTFKTPDAVADAAVEAGNAEAAERMAGLGRPAEEGEQDELATYWTKCFKEFAGKWVRYGEYVTIEFDTEAGTATVLPAGR